MKLGTYVYVAVNELRRHQLFVGKTNIQKIIYFAMPAEHRKQYYHPYYYGPYSEDIQKIVVSLLKKDLGYKKIRDPLYGFIRVDQQDLRLIDHKIIQRLRWVNQLPLEQLVYPSDQHSRFEHSLGVMHLAEIGAGSLIENSSARFHEACLNNPLFAHLQEKEQETFFIRCARWSGLLHDIGHAPFSHTFEEACKFSFRDEIFYDHEYYGFFLVRQVFEDLKDIGEAVLATVLNVLNKKIPLKKTFSQFCRILILDIKKPLNWIGIYVYSSTYPARAAVFRT